MAPAVFAGGEIVDVTRMPIGIGRNLRIGPATVGIDPRHHAMIAILETDIGGIDLVGRFYRLIKDVATVLGAKEGGIGGSDLRQHGQGPGHAVYHVLNIFNAGLPRLGDVVVQCRDDRLRGFVIIIG